MILQLTVEVIDKLIDCWWGTMVFGGILTVGLQNTVLAGFGVARTCKPIEVLPATSQQTVSPRGQLSIVSGQPPFDSSIIN